MKKSKKIIFQLEKNMFVSAKKLIKVVKASYTFYSLKFQYHIQTLNLNIILKLLICIMVLFRAMAIVFALL